MPSIYAITLIFIAGNFIFFQGSSIFMISISPLAASVLRKTLQESNVKRGLSLRLIRKRQFFLLQLDSPGETDRVIRYEGAIVLIVDKELENELNIARIDVEETPEGYDLVMRRPANPSEITDNIQTKHLHKKDKR
jgi:hypothetical protein